MVDTNMVGHTDGFYPNSDEETDNLYEETDNSDEETDNSQKNNLKCSGVELIQKRKQVVDFIKKSIKEGIKPSNHIHPLVLFGFDGFNKQRLLFNVNMRINRLKFEKLNRILNSPSPLHMFHYLCWKKKNFETSYEIERKKTDNIDKLLWNYKEMDNFKRNQDVIAILENDDDNKEICYIKGYISFDDKNFGDNRTVIAITEVTDTKKSVEIFDINEITICGKKEMPYYFTTNDEDYIFDRDLTIYPWDIKIGNLLSLTYLEDNDCKVKHFKVLENINGFTEWLVLNNDGKKENIDLKDYNTPILYQINKKKNVLGDYFIISCNNKRNYKITKSLHYSLESKDKQIIQKLIPFLKDMVSLGSIGEQLHIDNNELVNIISFQITDISLMINNVKTTLLNYIPELNINTKNNNSNVIFELL